MFNPKELFAQLDEYLAKSDKNKMLDDIKKAGAMKYIETNNAEYVIKIMSSEDTEVIYSPSISAGKFMKAFAPSHVDTSKRMYGSVARKRSESYQFATFNNDHQSYDMYEAKKNTHYLMSVQ